MLWCGVGGGVLEDRGARHKCCSSRQPPGVLLAAHCFQRLMDDGWWMVCVVGKYNNGEDFLHLFLFGSS